MRAFPVQMTIAALLSCLAILRTDFSPEALCRPQANVPQQAIGEEIFSQTYRFLGKGRQSFAFLSEDGKTVLKFFNRRYVEMPWYAFFFLSKEKEQAKRTLRRNFFSHSYRLAERFFSEEAGLLYVHLDEGGNLPKVSCIDRASRRFEIDLNGAAFVLQKKGESFYPALRQMERAGRERAIEGFLEIVARRISFGLADGDHDVEHNFALLGGRVMHLDPGRLSLPENISAEHEWWSATHRFRDWLEKNDPELISFFDAKKNALQTTPPPDEPPLPASPVLQRDGTPRERFPTSSRTGVPQTPRG